MVLPVSDNASSGVPFLERTYKNSLCAFCQDFHTGKVNTKTYRVSHKHSGLYTTRGHWVVIWECQIGSWQKNFIICSLLVLLLGNIHTDNTMVTLWLSTQRCSEVSIYVQGDVERVVGTLKHIMDIWVSQTLAWGGGITVEQLCNKWPDNVTILFLSRTENASRFHLHFSEWQPSPLWLQDVLDQTRCPVWMAEPPVHDQYCGTRLLVSRLLQLSRWILGWCWCGLWCWIRLTFTMTFTVALDFDLCS